MSATATLTAATSRPAIRVLALLLVCAAGLLLAGPDQALAARLGVKVSTPAGSDANLVAVSIRGARRARTVSLYVDGELRRRDRSYPWGFGQGGIIRLHRGEHRLKVAARFRHGKVRRRTVRVDNRRLGSQKRGSEIGVSPRRKLKGPRQQPPAPSGPVLFQGDFETGDLSQWDMIQRVSQDKITIAQDPRRQGNYAARFEVGPHDNIGDTSPRAEIAAYLHEQEGEERYYRWYTYFDPSFPTEFEDDFVTFTQWRAVDESDSYTSFMLWGDTIELRRDGTRWSTPLVKGVWHEFIYHVRWSPDPDVGFIELWYDGELVLPMEHVENMAGSPGDAVENYVKQGLYHEDGMPTGIIYHDGFVSGLTLDAVKGA